MLLVPQRERGMDEAALPGDYRRIMDVVRQADGPVMVKQVCTELGIATTEYGSEPLISQSLWHGTSAML
ncbi:hypothetical protein ABZS81_18700 [Streptomyces sp. NPDC005318]|uniref:hypothetical protein n=1 Tax=Streptomyces sp. NPDC005318 TaxID=3157031 RepID=UPI0033A8A085